MIQKKVVPVIGVAILFIALMATAGCIGGAPQSGCSYIKTSTITSYEQPFWEKIVDSDGCKYFHSTVFAGGSKFKGYYNQNVTFSYRYRSDWEDYEIMEIISVNSDNQCGASCSCQRSCTCSCNYQPCDCAQAKCGCGC